MRNGIRRAWQIQRVRDIRNTPNIFATIGLYKTIKSEESNFCKGLPNRPIRTMDYHLLSITLPGSTIRLNGTYLFPQSEWSRYAGIPLKQNENTTRPTNNHPLRSTEVPTLRNSTWRSGEIRPTLYKSSQQEINFCRCQINRAIYIMGYHH